MMQMNEWMMHLQMIELNMEFNFRSESLFQPFVGGRYKKHKIMV